MHEYKKEWIVNIANTSYKFTSNTILKIDQAIGHIKKNKSLYKFLVGYIALCSMPLIASCLSSLIYDLFMSLAKFPTDMAVRYLVEIIIGLSKAICMAGIACCLARSMFKYLVGCIKSKI